MEILKVVVPCLVLLSGCHTARGDDEGLVQDDRSRWLDARQQCLNAGPSCDLSTQRAQEHRTFWDSLALTAGSSYWIGARVMDRLQWQQSKKPLIEEVGCYEKPVGLKTDIRALRYNGPERCLTQCPGNVVAIQNTACYCLSEEQASSLVQRPLEECHDYCNKEAYRCGGDNARVSVYKIPDRTLYEKRGNSASFFWRLGNNNDNEFVLFTNKPGNQKQQFCVSQTGTYSTAKLKESCPAGGRAMSFEDVNVMEFLETVSSRSDLDSINFQLPLGYARQLLWLDGGKVTTAGGKGPCVAITFDGQQYSLVKKSCKAKLPSVCSCYTQPQTTEATTTVAPTTTTTTTQTPETTTTTTTQTSTTIRTTTMPESTTTMPESTTTTNVPETTTTTNAPGTSTTTTFAPGRTNPYAPEKTTTTSATTTTYTSEKKTTTYTPTTTTTYATEKSSTTKAPENSTTDAPDVAESQPDGNGSSNLLFPFSDMKESDAPSRAAEPPPASSGESKSDDDGPAAATASIELIVGTTVGAVALVLLVVVIVVFVVRRRRESSATLLKNKKSAGTNYPI